MKLLILSLIAISSLTAFAGTEARRCVTEYRALTLAQRDHVRSTDKVAADSLDTANILLNVANELIVQSDRRVGSYGYSLKPEGQKAIEFANRLQANAKAKEALVDTAMLALEDCLYGVETETTAE